MAIQDIILIPCCTMSRYIHTKRHAALSKVQNVFDHITDPGPRMRDRSKTLIEIGLIKLHPPHATE